MLVLLIYWFKISIVIKLNESTKNETKEHENQLNLIKTNLLKNVDDKLVKKVDKKSKIGVKFVEEEPNKQLKGVKKLSKKEKTKIKKVQWHEKINLIKSQLKESKAKVKRNKTVITGDMKGLEDALLATDDDNKKNKKQKNITIAKPKAVQRESVRNKQA